MRVQRIKQQVYFCEQCSRTKNSIRKTAKCAGCGKEMESIGWTERVSFVRDDEER